MKVLVVANQDANLRNLLDKARNLGENFSLLYILDTEVLESLKGYSHHILPAHMVIELEKSIVDMQKREVEALLKNYGDLCSEFIFEVGKTKEIAEKTAIKIFPDLMICDSNIAKKIYTKIYAPIWIADKGKISKICCYVDSIVKIKRTAKYINFAKKISEKIGADLIVVYGKYDEEGVKTLRNMHEKVVKNIDTKVCELKMFDRETSPPTRVLKQKGNIILF